MMLTAAPSGRGDERSTSCPFTVAATAALARPRPIDAASSPAVVPAGSSFEVPSGSVTVIWLMEGQGIRAPRVARPDNAEEGPRRAPLPDHWRAGRQPA